jgi:hypothetical protein
LRQRQQFSHAVISRLPEAARFDRTKRAHSGAEPESLAVMKRCYLGSVRQAAIIRHTRWNPFGLVALAVVVLPFALTGRLSGVAIAVVVWVVVAVFLGLWWRSRGDPRPPDHAI